jgi:hypothetical protein
MSLSKKKNPANAPPTHAQALKIGSRVRCTDDHVEGRIVWANAASVKIRWDDGEQVTWRRDSLANRPIEILAGDAGEPPQAALADVEQTATGEPLQAEPEAVPPTPPADETTVVTIPLEQAEPAPAEQPPADQAAPEQAAISEPPPLEVPGSPNERKRLRAGKAAQPKRRRQAPAEAREKKLSALDAAAQVLAEEGRPMTCPEMIDAMAAKGYWTSPGGKTPSATLYSAILSELAKGAASRFVKTERGKFSRQG